MTTSTLRSTAQDGRQESRQPQWTGEPSVNLQIDVTLWRKIVEGWTASQWAQHPEDDHKKIEFNFSSSLEPFTGHKTQHHNEVKDDE